MSEWNVQCVRLGKIGKHPNADTLSITQVHGGYPVIFKTGEFQENDLAVYIPVDSVVDTSQPEFSFLTTAGTERVKAKKLRGIFSMGMLVKPRPDMVLGQIVHEPLNMSKWVNPHEKVFMGDCAPDDNRIPKYTDIEGWRKYKDLFVGKEVLVHEKIHGANARFALIDGNLVVGSHNRIKKHPGGGVWSAVADKYDLANKLEPGLVYFCEVYGAVQDLKYGHTGADVSLRCFDVFDIARGLYLHPAEAMFKAISANLPTPPLLYRGEWKEEVVVALAEGPTMTGPGVSGGEKSGHLREGVVIRTVSEEWNPETGRSILKLVGEGFLLRKEK